MRLDPAAIAAGVRLDALAIVDSTNREARIRGRSGDRGPLWITAERQTAGRGRGDRSWFSPSGNLYASLLMRETAPAGRVPELAFVTALAVRDAIAAAAPSLVPHLALKWPNDVLLAGSKCAGILIEGEHEPSSVATVITGIGVNCAHYPQGPGSFGRNATSRSYSRRLRSPLMAPKSPRSNCLLGFLRQC